ncbi:MAG: hypothetical protein NUV53_02360 [Patescibacteria group bacterium]|nr:hypothetical protein [Patescibacteria group bacterium]
MSLTLMGMSNVGKSFWRKRFENAGFTSFSCDDRIELGLSPHLQANGYKGIQDVARWMGQPYETRYKECAALYLAEETSAMNEAILMLQDSRGNVVIDTTGSSIYAEEVIFKKLKSMSTMVALDAPESLREKLYRDYLLEPKPVIWGDRYIPHPHESPQEALARCYLELLRSRNAMYKRYADVVLEYGELRTPGFGVDQFLAKIEE